MMIVITFRANQIFLYKSVHGRVHERTQKPFKKKKITERFHVIKKMSLDHLPSEKVQFTFLFVDL